MRDFDNERDSWNVEEESWLKDTDGKSRRPRSVPTIPPDSGNDESIFDGRVK